MSRVYKNIKDASKVVSEEGTVLKIKKQTRKTRRSGRQWGLADKKVGSEKGMTKKYESFTCCLSFRKLARVYRLYCHIGTTKQSYWGERKQIPEAGVSVPEFSQCGLGQLRSYRSAWAMQPGGPVRPSSLLSTQPAKFWDWNSGFWIKNSFHGVLFCTSRGGFLYISHFWLDSDKIIEQVCRLFFTVDWKSKPTTSKINQNKTLR